MDYESDRVVGLDHGKGSLRTPYQNRLCKSRIRLAGGIMPPAGNLKPIQNDEEWEVVQESFPETFPFENSGDMVVGTYTSSKTVTQTDFEGKDREVAIYTLEDSNGKKWGIWGSWAIDEAFKKIEKGMLVRVLYEGTDSFKGDDGKPRNVKKFNIASKKA